jgi:hypothetical protein
VLSLVIGNVLVEKLVDVLSVDHVPIIHGNGKRAFYGVALDWRNLIHFQTT